MNWLSEGVNEYYEWLKKRTFVGKDEATGWSVVSTPFVGIFNDTIDIFVKTQADGRILLSDDGNTLGNLELLGVNFKSSMEIQFLTYGRKHLSAMTLQKWITPFFWKTPSFHE